MQGIWEIIPGSIAALLYVRTPETTGESQSVVWMSSTTGAVTGRRDTPLAQSGWPQEVQDSINAHFRHVFSLEHEKWPGPGLSPRAVYVDSRTPWTIDIKE